MIDPILSLALSVHSNPGVYGLLLGSGVSRTAGIPTGWEVVLDLIQKLALLSKETCDPDPEAWYRSKYQAEPDYAKLLHAIGQSPAERSQLLKRYFEPTEEEREQELKVPTAAHKAIANLVVNGYIRIIVTTNFDRLLEKALEAAGVYPTVISTPDAVDGAMPLAHTKCSIIKIHGDYLDTRIKNTPSELDQYDQRFINLLGRIFDEFGLITCGWSAEWDTALWRTIEGCPNRRFTTFWAARKEPQGVAKKLLEKRKGVFVQIQDADSFFQELEEKVLALEEINKPHPLSAKVAVFTVKRYVVDEHHRVRLHDLVMQEVEKVYNEISIEKFPDIATFNVNELVGRLKRYETLTEILLSIMITGCYWGEKNNESLWVKALQRLSLPPKSHPNTLNDNVWVKLNYYPALLLLYAGGIASLVAGNYQTFAALLLEPEIRNGLETQPVVLSLYSWKVMEANVQKMLPGKEQNYTPLSNHLSEFLRTPLKELLPDETQYQRYFDRFEYLFALVQTDLLLQQGNNGWGSPGRFIQNIKYDLYIGDQVKLEVDKNSNVENNSSNWSPLAAGLFGGSLSRYQNAKRSLDEYILDHFRKLSMQ
ncbi:MAG: SIR2 family protein [Crinalium sp.]